MRYYNNIKTIYSNFNIIHNRLSFCVFISFLRVHLNKNHNEFIWVWRWRSNLMYIARSRRQKVFKSYTVSYVSELKAIAIRTIHMVHMIRSVNTYFTWNKITYKFFFPQIAFKSRENIKPFDRVRYAPHRVRLQFAHVRHRHTNLSVWYFRIAPRSRSIRPSRTHYFNELNNEQVFRRFRLTKGTVVIILYQITD